MRTLFFCSLVLLLVRGLFGSRPARLRSDQAVEEIDTFITQEMRRHRLPGLALAVVRDGEVIHLQGYGQGVGGEPIAPQTQFFLASLSKSFTALAVLQLVEAGQLELDEPVKRYLPEFSLQDPAAAERITVRQLLNHTSGLADSGFPELRLPQASSPEERLLALRRARPVSAPGQAYAYFNPNYEILARLVETASGQEFSTYLAELLFAPLNMQNTFHVNHSARVEGSAAQLAQGHIFAYGFPLPLDEMLGYIGGSAGVISTAEDMANFLRMELDEGRLGDAVLVSPESLSLTHTPPSTPESDYGMGWIASEVNGEPLLEHNGILSSYYAEMVLLPDRDTGFILLYNANALPAQVFPYLQIKNGLIALLTGRSPETGGFTMGHWGLLMALLTVGTLGLSLRGLLRNKAPSPGEKGRPAWRTGLSVLWNLLPSALLAGMPYLASTGSGRVFGYAALARALPEIFIWLGGAAILGWLKVVRLFR